MKWGLLDQLIFQPDGKSGITRGKRGQKQKNIDFGPPPMLDKCGHCYNPRIVKKINGLGSPPQHFGVGLMLRAGRYQKIY